jgi:HK97 family phage major capsid protein
VSTNKRQLLRLAQQYGLAEHLVGRTVNDENAGGGDVDTLTIPDSPAALEEMLGDAKAMKKVFANKNAFSQFISNYARTVLEKDQEIATQVREETQRVLAQWLKDNQPDGIERVDLRPSDIPIGYDSQDLLKRGGLYNKAAMGAKLDKEFTGLGDYFKTIWHNTNRDAPMQAKLQRMRNAFSSTVPSEGGFLIPETLRSELLRVSLESAVVRSRARIIPMETLRVPFPAIDETSHASNVFGGITGYWTEEGAALTASSASFGRVVLDAKKLTAYTEVPNELLSDSILTFEAFIGQIFPEALAWFEDLAFFNGTGVGEPLGFLRASATVEVSDTATGGLFESILTMFSRMLPQSLPRAVWIASIDKFVELASLTFTPVGGTTVSPMVWLNNGQVQDAPPMTILGRPVIFSEKVPASGSDGDLNFVDFGFYLVGDRQVMSAMSSPHFKFQNDQTAFRIIERLDGLPWLKSAITPQNGGPTLSPFVKRVA